MTEKALKKTEETLPATHYENPWLEAASEAGNNLKLLKFVKGKWEIGDDTVPDNTEFIALVDQIARGWVRFDDGKVTDQVIGKIADGCKPPQREELSDNDPASWLEKDANGAPRDPWVKQWCLPLVAVESGDVVTFVTGSKGGNAAVGNLCRVYGHKKRDGLLPIVALKTGSYKHKQYGRIETPDLPIVGWDGVPTVPTAPVPLQPALSPQAKKVAAANGGDMNDEIPF